MDNIWPWVPIIGAIILGLAIIYSMQRNRKTHDKRHIEQTDNAAHRLRDEITSEDREAERKDPLT